MKSLIDQYEAGGPKIAMSIRGLLEEDLLRVPPSDAPARIGRWSIQQVVIHLMDDDLIWADRMKRMIAESNPAIMGFDESKYAANLFCDRQDAELAVQIFDLNRRQFTKVLRNLSEAGFARTGQHNERGAITVAQSVKWMVEHIDHHVGFIHAKRAWMGKEMW
jgi:uncharacterized damage-inducible protein DinB